MSEGGRARAILRRYEQVRGASVVVLVLAGTAFVLYTGWRGPYEPVVQRSVFLLLFLPLVFLMAPSRLLERWPLADAAFNLALALAAGAVMVYTTYHVHRLYSEFFLDPVDIAVGIVGILLVLESVRRTIGSTLTLLLAVFLAYAYYGAAIPWRGLVHGGLSLEDIAGLIFFGTNGVFGTPVGVLATFVVIVMMLGAFLAVTGGAEMFMNLAKSLAGRFVGGPAKIAVVGSAFMGMLTGATVANVATTGAVTIPMMKRAGYDPRFAGGIEALASSGGQLMPPIMGAAAFIMIDYLNISYGQLILHALIPAILFFFCVLMIVHVRSMRYGFAPVPKNEIPAVWPELRRRGHMLIPILVLVVLLFQHMPIMYAAFLSVMSAFVLCMLRPATRLGLRSYYEAFRQNVAAIVPLIAVCAGAGILIGTMTTTGLNLKIAYLIELIGGGNMILTLLMTMIACLILGMGLPTVAAYLILATLVPAPLLRLGVEPLESHMFIFYFAILSAITPPVCTGAFVAAGIANANPMQTGVMAFKMALPLFLLPFAFVWDPALLGVGSWSAIIYHFAATALGLALWAIGVEGYLKHTLDLASRSIFLISGVLLVVPSITANVAGIVLAGITVAYGELHRRAARGAMATAGADDAARRTAKSSPPKSQA